VLTRNRNWSRSSAELSAPGNHASVRTSAFACAAAGNVSIIPAATSAAIAEITRKLASKRDNMQYRSSGLTVGR
jgi:hypothetical protein